MTIRIEVTGDSLPEVADKLLALAGQFGRGCGYDHTPNAETIAAMQELQDKPKTTRKTKKAEPETEQEDAGNAASNAEAPSPTTNSETSSPAAETAKSLSEAPTLDFDKEVAPVVIDAVQRLGKPAVSALLSEFGVERASEVDPSLYGELVDRLKAL